MPCLLRRIACLWLVAILILGLPSVEAQDEAKMPEAVATLKGHSDWVYSVAFSSDGKYVVTGSFDSTLKLWETATGKEIKTFGGAAGHQKQVLTVAVSPDGLSIASGSADNTLKIWDVPSLTPLRSLTQADSVNAVALSPDGSKLAVASKDGTVQVWNPADFKKPLLVLTGHGGSVTGVAFSANGQFLASSGADKTVRFWNAANGQLIAAIGAHTASANAVLFNPNNTAAYSVGDDGLLKFWQVPPPGPRPLPAHSGAVTCLSLSGDGNTLLSGGADKAVRITQLAAAKEIRVFTGATGNITSVALSSKADVVAAGTSDSRLLFWNANDGKPISQLTAHAGSVTGVSWHPQTSQVLTVGSDGLLKLWALPAPARVLSHPEAVLAATISTDGKRLFTGSADKLLRSWDTTKNAIERQFAGHTGAVTAVATSANGQLLVSGSGDATVRIWNQATAKESDILGAHGGTVTALALNAAGNQVLSSSEDGTLKMWQLPIAGPKAFVHPDQVTCLALSPDGTRILTGCGDRQTRLWNIASGAKEKDFAGPTQSIQSVAFSGNGSLAAAGSADKSVCVWNTADGKLLKKVDLAAVVNAVALSPDGKFVAAGLADSTLRIVDFAGGKEIKNITGHKGPVTALVYRAKGDQLLAASGDKSIQLWNVGDGASKAKFDHVAPVTSLALRKDDGAFAAAAEKTVKVWNLGDGKLILTFTTPADIKAVGFAPDGSRLVVAGTDNRVRIYGMDGKLQEFFAHDAPVLAAAFLDAKRVVSAGADKTARLWTSTLIWQRSHAAAVRHVLFTPKGDQVLSAGDDKTIRLWNAGDGKELRTIAAHDGAAIRLAVNSDGTRLVSAAADKTVKVWNLAQSKDEKPVAVFNLPGPAQSVALSPNGQRIAVSVAEDKSQPIRIFDIAAGREIFVSSEHTAPVPALSFLGDNRTVVSASADKSVRFSDIPLLAILDGHKDGVLDVQFSANGAQALSAGGDKTIKLWDIAKGAVLKTFPMPDAIKALAWSRDNTLIATASGKTVKVINAGDGKELASINVPADVRSLSISPDKTKLAVGTSEKVTRVLELPSGRELQFFPQESEVVSCVFDTKNTGVISAAGNTPRLDTLSVQRVNVVASGPLHTLAMTGNNTHVLTGGADKQVKFWNLANGQNDRSLPPVGETIRAVAVSKNNILIAVATADQVVRVVNFADGKELGSVKVSGPVRSLAFAPNNQILAAACEDKSLTAWNVTFTPGQPLPVDFLKPIQSFAHDGPVTDLVFSGDSATIYAGSVDKTVRAWRLGSPAPTRNFPHPNHVHAVAFHPTLPQVASGGHDGKVRIFDLAKGAQIREINAHPAPNMGYIYTIAFSADGKFLVSGSYDNSLKLWDPNTGNMVREFKAYKVKESEQGHQEAVFAAAFSPDNKYLASGSAGLERVIKIWNVADGKLVRDLVNPNIKSAGPKFPQSHPGWVYKLRFSKDGKLISIGDAPKNQGYLAIWNPDDGKLLYGETLHLGTFFGLAVSPDSRLLAIGAGPRDGPEPQFNSAYLMKIPIK